MQGLKVRLRGRPHACCGAIFEDEGCAVSKNRLCVRLALPGHVESVRGGLQWQVQEAHRVRPVHAKPGIIPPSAADRNRILFSLISTLKVLFTTVCRAWVELLAVV